MILILPITAALACARTSPRADEDASRIPVFEIFVLPDGYRGPLLTIYGQPGGAIPSWKADTAVYPMPSNGILRIAGAEPPHSTKTAYVFANRRTDQADSAG